MNLGIILFICSVSWCFGERLTPLENNYKLEDVRSRYVAEWQWESWPIKQEPSEQYNRSPGPRINVALWKDTSGPTWYLFGGQPIDAESKKIYSDVWKYSVTTRVWERFFPPQSDVKGASMAKIGGMMTLRANLFDENQSHNSKPIDYNIVLCGGVTKLNITKSQKPSLWENFTRKKKQEEKKTELKSLAVYAPKTSKSNTVWQIDVKDKLWTAYVCCCDNTNDRKENSTLKILKPIGDINVTKDEPIKYLKLEKNVTKEKNESLVLNANISKTEEEVDNEQQHLEIANSKGKKKKINQSKKVPENLFQKSKLEKREANNTNISIATPTIESKTTPTTLVPVNKTEPKTKKAKYNLKIKDVGKSKPEILEKVANKTEKLEKFRKPEKTEKVDKIEKIEKIEKAKPVSKYCPEFAKDGQPVTWCNGNSEVLITADVNMPQITLWIFNLKTSHWSQQAVKLAKDVEWPGCSASNVIRFAANEDEVYIICSPLNTETKKSLQSLKNLTSPSEFPSEDNSTLKLIYRINYKQRLLNSLGRIKLNPYFKTPKGQKVWENDTESIFQVIKTPDNQTILMFIYLDSFDMWILTKVQTEFFDPIEKVYRGSALKWYVKYNAPLYNLQFTSDTGMPETILVPNPRMLNLSDYWPRERGRFIVRIFKNENLKSKTNRSFENRTREQNLTYELLQSYYKPPTTESQLSHAYSLKVLVFFGISLAIFSIFGFIIFLKRCVTCPPKIRVRTECHKSPLVIRYSVIPDDLLYPIA